VSQTPVAAGSPIVREWAPPFTRDSRCSAISSRDAVKFDPHVPVVVSSTGFWRAFYPVRDTSLTERGEGPSEINCAIFIQQSLLLWKDQDQWITFVIVNGPYMKNFLIAPMVLLRGEDRTGFKLASIPLYTRLDTGH